MRITIIILGSFAGPVLVSHAAIPLRLNELIEGRARTLDAAVWVAFFVALTIATALVYTTPSVAFCLFAASGVSGLFLGATTSDRLLTIWAAVAIGLALLTLLACWEKRAADRTERYREEREVAVHLALRSLQETVPELLACGPDADQPTPVQIRSSPPHPIVPTPDVAVRRQADFARNA
jgi:hypothetical protein